MKYLKTVFSRIETRLLQEFGFEERSEFKECLFRVYRIPEFRKRSLFLVLDGVESRTRCCFVCYCYSSIKDEFDKNLAPTGLPDEVEEMDVVAFDITLLESRHARTWSLFNDKLDRAWDGPFIGSEERIRERGDEAANSVTRIIRDSLLPLLKKLESKI